MGTTSQKLTYLNDTKAKIRDGINAIGGSLDSDDTFRSYADELESLYGDMPKVSDTGTNITLDGTRPGKMILDYNGDTQQDSTTGKNLNNYPYQDATITRNGISYTDNGDGTINVNGTATATAYYNMTTTSSNKPIKLKAGTYTASLGIASNVRATIANYYNVSEVVATIPVNTSTKTFTINTDMDLTFALAVNNGGRVDNVLIRPQLELGSSATPYEEYTGGIPAPNPQFPMPINVVTGRQELDMCGKNLLNKELIVSGNTSNWEVEQISNGVKITHLRTYTTGLPEMTLNLKPNTNYTFKYILGETTSQTTPSIILVVGDGGNQYIASNTIKNFTTTETGVVVVRVGNGVDSETYANFNNILLYEGTYTSETIPDYEAYTGYTQEINLGKNLISSVGQKVGNMIFFNNVSISENYQFKAGTYTFSYKDTNNRTLYVKDSDGTSISLGQSKTISFTSLKDFNIWLYGSGITIEELSEVQLEKGSQASSYSAYFTPIELCKIGTYQDYLFYNTPSSPYYNNELQDYKWFLHKEINKAILNGSETITQGDNSSYSNTILRFNITVSDKKRNTGDADVDNILCNMFTARKLNYDARTVESIAGHKNDYALIIFIDTSRLGSADVTGFQTWLGTNKPTVYYVLDTSTDTEITNSALLAQLELVRAEKSKLGQTNIIITSDDLPAILNASALKEWSNE